MSVAPDVVDRVRASLAEDGTDATPARVAAALRRSGRLYGDATVLAVVDELRRDTLGAGPLDALLRRPGVTDVLVNGPDQVFVDAGAGLEPAGVRFDDDEQVRRLASRLAAAAGRRLDDASPWVDVRLPDGTRFHAVLAPLARPGTALSLRVPARRAFTLDDLRAAGAVGAAGAAVLRALVASRAAFLVTGGTGSGKTTLLAALLGLVDPAERLVVVEDASELRPDHPHVVGLEGRPVNVEGAGSVTVRDLVRQALRMRPDRLVVGEVRGAEVVDLLAALNTGHEGGCGTVHANSARDLPARMEALGVAAGLSRAAVHSQLVAALDVVVHLDRGRDGVRRVREVAVVEGGDDGLARTSTAVAFDPDGSARAGPGAARLESVLEER
ncbi:TadA family conjugal transfer-associated ATPase [Solicola sp. PLA-1-18]|uniref:TadA family conjugal transfer-associated ATPase n=1 Tax=Solicola sp. PLA-1-18 TaxID=3380532 RepID=UPI003B7D7C1C